MSPSESLIVPKTPTPKLLINSNKLTNIQPGITVLPPLLQGQQKPLHLSLNIFGKQIRVPPGLVQ